MAETSTAEVVREREPAPADTSPTLPPPPPPPSAPSTPSDPVVAFGQWMASREKEQQGLDARNAAMAPRIAQTQQALDTRVQQIAQNPPPPPPQLPPPPKRDLSAFLSPREGESAEASVQKLIQAIGLFAGGVGGLAKGDARGSLAAFTGALKGWNEGDIERGDRAFADWQAKTKAALTQWETERASYLDWLAVGNVSVDQMMRGIELQAMQSGNEQAAAAFRSGTLGEGVKFLQQQQQAAADFANARARIIEAHEGRLGREAYQREQLEEKKRHNREVEGQAKAQATNALEALGPDGLQAMGALYVQGKLPPGIARGKGGTFLMPAIVKAGVDGLKAQGIDPMTLPTIQADVGTLKDELKKLRTTAIVSEAVAARFDTHLDAAVQLSEKLDRSQRPVWARWELKARGQYQGDADVARYEVQLNEVAMEYVKMTVGTAQGDAGTRAHARELINSWLNKPQLKAIAEQLSQNAHNNVANNRALEQQILHRIDTLGGRLDKPESAPAPAKVVMPNDAKGGAARITIVNTKDPTQRGSVPADTDLSKYPDWKRE